MDPVNVFLFGRTSLEKAGKPLEMDTRKAIALFAYMLVSGGSYNRDTLATFLWPDSDQSGARGALRRTLSSLRKAIGEENLQTSRDQVSLSPGAVIYCDVLHFRELLSHVQHHHHEPGRLCEQCLDRLSEAVRLYHGDFMAGFSLRDSLNFDNWQFVEAEQFRRELSGALVALCETLTALGNYQNALEHCRQWLALDPLNEAAHCQIMKLLAFSGQREAALRQYRECVRILEAEIGVPPLDETTQLYEAIKMSKLVVPLRESAVAPPTGSAQSTTPGHPNSIQMAENDNQPAGQLPLVGRRDELDELLAFYSSMKSEGRFAALVGEAGIGKTRLSDEFLNILASKKIAIISSRCYQEERGMAYSLFNDLLKKSLETGGKPGWWHGIPAYHLAETSRLVPDLSGVAPGIAAISPVEGPGAQTRFFEGVSQVLFELASPPGNSNPGVLFLDDLHWIDNASLDLLAFIIRRMVGRPIFVLATWQNDQSEPVNRLRALHASLQRDNRSILISLNRLNHQQAIQLIKSAEDLIFRRDQRSFVNEDFLTKWGSQLIRESEGNPFILTAYLQSISREENIPVNNHFSPPDAVREMILARLSVLGHTTKQVLQTAAVTGRSFDFQTLLEVSGRSEEETVASIEELISHGFIREIPAESSLDVEYDFSHEILRKLVCEEISLARTRLLHRRIAESMEHRLHSRWDLASSSASRTLAGQISGKIAFHYQEAGEISKAAAYLRLAGQYERALYANEDALVHFNNALALGHPDRAGLYLEIGDLQVLQGDYSAAVHSFQTAASQHRFPGSNNSDVFPDRGGYQGLREASGTEDLLAQAEWKIGQVYGRLGNWDQALAQFEVAFNVLTSKVDVLRARILVDQSLAFYHTGNLDRAEKIARQALSEAIQTKDILAQAQTHNLIGVLKRHQKDLQGAREHLNTSLLLAERLSDPAILVAAMNNLALAFQDLGDVSAAIELVNQALKMCQAQGDRHREAALRNHLADLYRLTNGTEEAMNQLKLAVAIFAEIGELTGQWQPEIWKLVEW